MEPKILDWLDWHRAFWHATKVLRKTGMKDIKGKPMWPKMAKVAEECATAHNTEAKHE